MSDTWTIGKIIIVVLCVVVIAVSLVSVFTFTNLFQGSVTLEPRIIYYQPVRCRGGKNCKQYLFDLKVCNVSDKAVSFTKVTKLFEFESPEDVVTRDKNWISEKLGGDTTLDAQECVNIRNRWFGMNAPTEYYETWHFGAESVDFTLFTGDFRSK